MTRYRLCIHLFLILLFLILLSLILLSLICYSFIIFTSNMLLNYVCFFKKKSESDNCSLKKNLTIYKTFVNRLYETFTGEIFVYQNTDRYTVCPTKNDTWLLKFLQDLHIIFNNQVSIFCGTHGMYKGSICYDNF